MAQLALCSGSLPAEKQVSIGAVISSGLRVLFQVVGWVSLSASGGHPQVVATDSPQHGHLKPAGGWLPSNLSSVYYKGDLFNITKFPITLPIQCNLVQGVSSHCIHIPCLHSEERIIQGENT